LFGDLVRLHGKWYPDKVAMIDEERSCTWGAIDRSTTQVANGLHSMGIGRGDSVAIIMTNCVEFVEVILGIWKAGAVVVPLNLSVSDEAMEMMLRDAGTRAVFLTAAEHQRMASRLGHVESLRQDGIFVHGGADAPGIRDYQGWRDGQGTADARIAVDDHDPCNIIYSSGTTGVPKGIKHAYGPRVRAGFELTLAHRYHYGAIGICPIGLYSNVAWATLFSCLIVGGTFIIQRRFDPQTWVSAVQKYRVTHTMMVPLQIQYVLDAPNFSPAAVASLEAVVSGGSPLYAELKQRAITQFDCAIIELYGLTEGFMTTLQPEEAEGRLASVGKPVRGHDYIVLDNDDQPLGWGHTGEICVRSIHWMIEYHNRPDATAEVMYIDADGRQWLRTGDIGRVDADGYLYIVDRKKDMILSGAQNIYPADIESVMVGHPQVSEVAVIGIPHEKWGETPLALVVARNPERASADEILRWTNERVGKRQRLSGVEIRPSLPRNPNGKVLKRELRKPYWERRQGG
jgi:acyl-CoA synthetase (AMP-forming)/AMP-acid ligase II